MKKHIGFTALALICSANAFAQDETQSTDSGYWSFGAAAAIVNIDEDTARQQGIDDSAYSIGFTADYFKSSWVTTLGLDIVVYDDNEAFSQVVIGDGLFNDGDVSVESSDANGILLSVATGYRWEFGEKNDVSVTLQGGYGVMLASERTIENCSNCFSEDIDVDGGLFAKASLMKRNDSFDIGIFAQQYFGGDGVANAFGIAVNFPL
ncbi:hypothetical protein QTP81_14840 [Alteromonas sp. ASW11-36]|uniref:Outer membrane protein beta-barrel domain-containing protein n=1 Tax=Alteromonas arenosi TaxID=3055817 RepID=A0ABT7T0B3_9ALTE|nr:hypothetical protein [Alteromonas sp. ASW11-36]MDM7861877.1 hypothetical protein [Alteromonas sp. ASW11-36]